MKIDFVVWNIAYSLGWNWGASYCRVLNERGLGGFTGPLARFEHTGSDAVVFIDTAQICRDAACTVDLVRRVKARGHKIICMFYESVFNWDFEEDGFDRKLAHNDLWRTFLASADLLVVSDPRDKYCFEHEPHGLRIPRVEYIPLAADPAMFAPQQEIIPKACFIGSRGVGDRPRIFESIPEGIIDFPNTSSGGIEYQVRFNDTLAYARTCGKYAVNLNLRTLFSGVQVRVYETMALGRVCLSHKTRDLPGRVGLWTQLRNVAWYDSPEQIAPKIRELVSDMGGTSEMGARARQEFLQAHTTEHRVDLLVEHIRNLR